MLATACAVCTGVPTDVAVTMAWPGASAVSTPLESIVATAAGATDQVTDLSGTPEGATVAVNCCVCPTMSCAARGVTVTDSTDVPVGFTSFFAASQPLGQPAAARQATTRTESQSRRNIEEPRSDYPIPRFPHSFHRISGTFPAIALLNAGMSVDSSLANSAFAVASSFSITSRTCIWVSVGL